MSTNQIVISGDTAKLKQDFEAMTKSAAAINKSLTEALSPKPGAPLVANIQGKFEQADEIVKSYTENLKKAKEGFEKLGKELGLPKDAFERFVDAKTEAFETQTTQTFVESLRAIQKELGIAGEDMEAFAKNSFGKLGEKFTPLSGLEMFLEKPMEGLAKAADKKGADFYDKTLPEQLGNVSNAFADLFSGIVTESHNASKIFSDFGSSIKKTATDAANAVIAEFMRAQMSTMLFGSAKDGSGGLFGLLVKGIGSFFAGNGGASSSLNWSGNLMGHASGGAYSGSSGLSALSGSIVASPTLFNLGTAIPAFARGIGLMGEAGPEAIMPLRRGPGGRLGVEASGMGSQQQAPQVNVNISTPPGMKAQTEQHPNQTGGWDMDVLIDFIDNSMAGGIASRRSKTFKAMQGAF